MCGRYTLRHPERLLSPEQLLEQIDERRRRQGQDQGENPDVVQRARYNIAPSQPILVVGRDAEGERVTRIATWGFRPKWLQRDRRAPINARAETVATTPMFRQAFRRSRCLVPADGWYEWQAQPSGPKVPYFFHRPDDEAFWFAGVATTDAAGEPTAAILTTDANETAAPIHSRMPLVLPDDETAAAWIDADAPATQLEELLRPPGARLLETYPVSRRVNKPANDDPECIEQAR